MMHILGKMESFLQNAEGSLIVEIFGFFDQLVKVKINGGANQ